MVGLRALLHREIQICDELLALLDAERRAIVLNQTERLAATVAGKEAGIGELAKLEAERLAFLAPLAADRGVAPAQLRAADLAADPISADAERASGGLAVLTAELAAKLRVIDRANRDNRVLLQDALGAVGMTLNVLQRLREGQPGYDRAGRSRQGLKGSAAVDQRL